MLRRAHKNFSFRNGRSVLLALSEMQALMESGVGNYFLAAAQSFFMFLPSAVFLFSSITNSQASYLIIYKP